MSHTATHTPTRSGAGLLRRALQVDFGVSTACTLMLLLAAAPLAAITGLPEMLILGTGVIFVPFLLLIGWLATRQDPPRTGVWLVIALNAGWAVGTVIFLAIGVVEPTSAGYALIIGIGVAVAIFAEMEFIGLRRSLLQG